MKNLSRWVHLALLIILLHIFPDHTLEALILLAFMYDVGFDIPAVELLIGCNSKFKNWLVKKLDKKGKKNG